MNITQKIITSHLIEHKSDIPLPGEKIQITADQTLLQDSTGTMLAYNLKH